MSQSNPLAVCRESIERIAEGPASTEQVLAALEAVRALGDLYRGLKERMDELAIDHIQKHGEIHDGVRRYYVDVNKSTKCLDVRGTLAAVLEAGGGDVDAIGDCLASDAFKPGATKKLLGPEIAKTLFEDRVTKNLKTGEASPPRLQTVDDRYTKTRSRNAVTERVPAAPAPEDQS